MAQSTYPITIATLKEGKPQLALAKPLLTAAFQITFGKHHLVKRVSVVGKDNERYLMARGFDAKGNSKVMRFPLIKRGNKLSMDLRAKGESCSGNPCSKCDFATGGGCTCVGGTGTAICNHTISRLTNFRFLAL